MSCCKASLFGPWCSKYETRIIDGKEYCIFHAPADRKWISSDAFKNLIFEHIDSSDDKCDFSGAIFNDDLAFNEYGTEFPELILQQTEFFGVADFFQLQFNKKLNLWFSIFHADVDFRECVFKNVDFSNTTFDGAVSFKDSHFFISTFSVTEFNGPCLFVGVIFENTTYFDYCVFRDGDFARCRPKISLNFVETKISNVKFFESDIRNMYFPCSALCRTMPIIRSIESLMNRLLPVNFKKIHAMFGRYTLKDEELLALRPLKSIENRDVRNGSEACGTIEGVEDLYRKLKSQCADNNNQNGFSVWHYNEKEMFRRQNIFRRFFGVSFLYWVTSGYGERPLRASLFLVGLFVVLQFILNSQGMNINPTYLGLFNFAEIKGFSFYIDYGKVSALFMSTMQHLLFVKEPFFVPGSICGQFVMTIFTKVFIPLQTALFFFALRNKFKR